MRKSDQIPNTKVFQGKVFVLAGKFGTSKRWSRPYIAKLVRLQGGRVDQSVSERTTHLITTLEEYKRRPTAVVKALARGKARCRIVGWEYIEDSLFGKSGPRSVSTNYYELQSILRRQRRFKEAREIYDENYKSLGAGAAVMVDPGLNHVYKDTTGFKYDIVLSRPIPRDNDNIVYERFRLMMFESNAGPYTYMTGIKYTRPGKPTAYIRNYLSPSEFCEAFNAFKRVFKQKTGIPWDKRLDGITVTSLEAAAGKDTSEETIAIDKIPFIYSPPARDLPRGDMPHNWKDPIEEAKKKEEAKRLASEMKIRAKNAKRAEAELKKLKALEEDAERMAKQIEEMERWSGSDDDSIGVSLETDDEDDSDDSSMETD